MPDQARETEKVAEKRAALQTDGRKRAQAIRALEREIERLEDKLKDPIEEVDPEPHQRKVVRFAFSHIGADLMETDRA